MGPGFFWVVRSSTLKIQARIVPCLASTVTTPIGCMDEIAVWLQLPGQSAQLHSTIDEGDISMTPAQRIR
jgi:hypothetical protein